jgi:hypothetical protein
MIDQFIINFFKELSIPSINDQYYNSHYSELDEVHANYAMILTILLMISIVVIWA